MGCYFFGFLEPWGCWETRDLFELLEVLIRPRCKSFSCSLIRESQKELREGALYLVPIVRRASFVEWKVDTKTEYPSGSLVRMP